jgi:hypothetical protein
MSCKKEPENMIIFPQSQPGRKGRGVAIAGIVVMGLWSVSILPAYAQSDEDMNWVALNILKGRFDGAANTGGERRDTFEKTSHRAVYYRTREAVIVRLKWSVDKHYKPANWPGDIALSPDIRLAMDIDGPKPNPNITSLNRPIKVPAGSKVTLRIDQDTFTSGYKTFFPAKWKIKVMYKSMGEDSGPDPIIQTGKYGDVEVITLDGFFPDPVAEPDTNQPECGSGLECKEPNPPQMVDPPAGNNAKPSAQTVSNGALDLAFWKSISASTNPAMFKAYLKRFPNGVFAPIAREKLRLLAGATSQPPANPVVDDGLSRLARNLQKELRRVGCYDMEIDGKWGPGSVQALRNFNHWGAGPVVPVTRPTQRALDVLRKTGKQVCGLD